MAGQKKTLSVKIPAELKKSVDQIAKKRGMRVGQLVEEWIHACISQSTPSKEIMDQLLDTIHTHGTHKPDGVLALEIKHGKNAVIYAPDSWAISGEVLNKHVKIPRSVLQLAAADLQEYNLIDPESRNKFTASLVKHLVKTLNLYSLGGTQNFKTAVEKIFKQEIPDPIILARKISPIRLTKICEANSSKRVVYVFDLKEFGEYPPSK